MLLSSGLLSIFALLPWALAQSCHFPDGSVAGSDVPCNPSALVSACCFSDQACLSNGLCVSDPLNDALKAYHRGTCTDQNFKSSACPRFCELPADNGTPVFSCNTTVDEYCCYDNCQCNSSYETMSFSGEPYTLTIIGQAYTNTHVSTSSASSASSSTTSSGASSSSPASASASVTSSAASTTIATSSSPSNNSHSTAIGVGVGVGVGGALLVLAGVAAMWYFRRRRGAKYQAAHMTPQELPEQHGIIEAAGSGPIKYARSELPVSLDHFPQVQPMELDGTTRESNRQI
ncbi:uncharacterized protein K441DRAFT_660230 [Cenococcum geophilum 1.58]|uniref:uncharacterized protein n=1 Tax=Cenococcum geophilum 1.58 TaxID=794803 RepID=UPI00358F0B3B|nr:hypothetical protein K441DRAFT_660230 [Cenococcum geophilum 1.58]